MNVMLPEVDLTALENLKGLSDASHPYFSLSCIGDTGAGKSFLLRELLQHLDAHHAPLNVDLQARA